MSPAATRSPALKGSAAIRPLTSGSILTSVVLTMPTTGGGGAGLSASAPMPAITPARTVAMTRTRRRRLRSGGMSDPPAAEIGARHCEQEIGQQQPEQGQPIPRYLCQARAHLVDAHHAVDRRFGREGAADRTHDGRDRLDGPGETDQEELRQGGGDEQHDGRFAVPEPGSRGLAEKAGGQY